MKSFSMTSKKINNLNQIFWGGIWKHSSKVKFLSRAFHPVSQGSNSGSGSGSNSTLTDRDLGSALGCGS